MARNARTICLCLLLTGCCLYTWGQHHTGFHITQFDETSGLRNNRINAMIQDSRGYLWFGTANGLYRYDGYVFKVFRRVKGAHNSIASNAITKLAEDRNGRIWIGLAREGLSCYDPATGIFTNYPLHLTDSQRIATPAVSMLYIDQENAVWAGITQKGIVRLDRSTGQLQPYPIISDTSTLYSREFRPAYNSAYDMHEERKGVFWLATHDGLYRFEPARQSMVAVRSRWPIGDVLRDDLFGPMLADGQGLWLGSWAGGLSHYDIATGRWSNYKFSKRNKDIGTTNIIQDIKARNERELWIASADGGLGIFNKQTHQFTFLGTDNGGDAGIPSYLVDRILQDNQQNLWLGHTEGLTRIREREKNFAFNPVQVRRTDNGPFYAISALLEDRAGRFQLTGTAFADGLHVLDNTTGKTRVLGFPSMAGEETVLLITDIIQDRKGGCWVLTRDFIYQYDPVKQQLVLPPQPPPYMKRQPSNSFIMMREDVRGRLWIASERNGLYCYDPAVKRYTHHCHDPGNKGSLPSNVIRTIAIDRRGRIWFGNRRGAFGYFDDSTKTYENPDRDMRGGESVRKNHVYALYADQEGDIWAGTDAGLFHYDGQHARPFLKKLYNADNGLQEELTIGIQADAAGNIWTITPPNICMISRSDGSITSYGKADGLRSVGLSNGLALLRNGNMALLTTGGYYTFDPSFSRKSSPVPLLVTSFKVDDKEVFCENRLNGLLPVTVPSGVNVISFEFAALDFNRPDKQEYAYMLEGFDKDWVMAGQRRYAGYANIPGGDYVFKVKATSDPGNWNTGVVSLAVHVKRPFYHTWWFLLCTAVILAASLYGFYRAKLAQQQQILQLETRAQVLEKEKTQVLYENLKQHLNPHFLFNSLTSLSSLIRIDQKMAGSFLDRMSKIYRYILKNRNSEVVPLSEELKFVQLYIDLQVTRFEQGLRINRQIDEVYYSRKIAPVTLQNLVENAIKHNLVDVESPLVIDLFVEQEHLVVRNNLQKKNFVETSNRQGLANMQSLYRFLSKKPMLIEEDAQYFTVKIPLL